VACARIGRCDKGRVRSHDPDELHLFLDRNSLERGDLWRERVEQALGEAPFFIAIVTPKYVRSVECRRELLAVSREAHSRGLGKLLLPILFIDIKDLNEESDALSLAYLALSSDPSHVCWWMVLRLGCSPPSPALRATTTASARLRARSLVRMSLTRLRTLFLVSTRRRAMAALSSPCAIKCRISRSRGVSCGNGSAAVASRGVAKKLSTRLVDRDRLPDRLRGHLPRPDYVRLARGPELSLPVHT
jgi:hypothetical protein